MPMKIAFYTLGCKVNQYETQALKEQFSALGYAAVDDQEPADVYVVNTCTVTGLADRKSRQYIRKMKKLNPDCVTAVIGCYAQANPEEVKAIDGVDIVLGTNEKNDLPGYVERFLTEKRNSASEIKQLSHIRSYEELDSYEETGIITSMESRTRAYIKIQEGCDQFCSYCVIPYARGGIRSRGPSEVVSEAESLIQKGFKEIVLTGINTALYGMEKDFQMSQGQPEGIEGVISILNALPGDFRFRLGSLEPTVINAGYVSRLLKYEKLCHHMHLSVQSGSGKILKAMNRHYSCADYISIVKTLRETDPDYGLTTDIIVGFPGETEEDFMESVRFVKEVGYSKVHVFPYSKRPGTAAAAFENQIPPNVKKERAARLAEEADFAAVRFHDGLRGTVRKVLFEEYNKQNGEISGFSDNYIRIYCSVPDCEEAEDMLNGFWNVTLGKPYKDGIKGDCGSIENGVL